MIDEPGAGGMMDIVRLAAILDAYGADAGRWPAAERGTAESLLSVSAEARLLRERAARLDLVLNNAPAPLPSPVLREAILSAAPAAGHKAARRNPSPLHGLWGVVARTLAREVGGLRPAGAMLGAALLLGVLAGGVVETGFAPSGDAEIDFVNLAMLDEQFSGY